MKCLLNKFNLIISGALLCCAVAWAEEIKEITILIDLDGTLVRGYSTSDGDNKIQFNLDGDSVELALQDDAAIMIRSLLAIPGCKIGFFSLHYRERMLEILKRIPVSGGKTALDLATYILSGGDTTKVGNPLKQPELFRGPRKKDLLKIQGIDLEWVILIDNEFGVVMPGQERNLLKVFSPKVDLKKLNKRDAFMERRKLMFARGVIELALGGASVKEISLAQALFEIQFDAQGVYQGSIPMEEGIYLLGLDAFRTVDPAYLTPKEFLARTRDELAKKDRFFCASYLNGV